jgi:DNA uptake protein ComE-like DNA-binding protein
MNQNIPSWIYFSRQERRAITLLIILIMINLIIRYWIIPVYKTLPEPHWKEFTILSNDTAQNKEIIRGYLYDTSLTTVKPSTLPIIIEINTTDSATLENLPMIGGFLAKKIIDYRDALGGYLSLDQLLEIKYLKEEVWENLRSKWKCNGNVHCLNINSATIEQLAAHPYLSYTQAKRLVHYKIQHGTYQNKEQIKLAKAIPDSMWHKIMPYLAVDSIPQ